MSSLGLVRRSEQSLPKPVSWQPSQYWDGDDGSWSSFALRVGKPEQTVRVLISTAGQSTWLVIPEGCPDNEPGTSPLKGCKDSRGGIYDQSDSKSFHNISVNLLGPNEVNLGYEDSAGYGLDDISLGFTNTTGGPSLPAQMVAGFATNDYYTGLFGLSNQPTNLTDMTDPHPSFLTSLNDTGKIPSLSWAYTAGAPYQSKGSFGSLTFGGYDQSRFVPNNVSFSLAPDITRDLVVGLGSLTAASKDGTVVPLLSKPINIFIDSTLPYIYLPLNDCKKFEKAFGLKYNETLELYLISDSVHQSLLAKNPKFTFRISDSQSGGPTVDIVLPYASFDLTASTPMLNSSSRYFPLARATNETQYTLGRTFLQEAYLITNYEHSNFSVSQAKAQGSLPSEIIAIPSANAPHNTDMHSAIPSANAPQTVNTHSHKRGVVIGSTIGVVSILALLLTALLFLFTRRRSRNRRLQDHKDAQARSVSFGDEKTGPNMHLVAGLHEIHHNSFNFLQQELPNDEIVEIFDKQFTSGSNKEMVEMPEATHQSVAYELQTSHHNSVANTLTQIRSPPISNNSAIFVSTGITHQRTDSASTTNPTVETIITSPARAKLPSLHESPQPHSNSHSYRNSYSHQQSRSSHRASIYPGQAIFPDNHTPIPHTLPQKFIFPSPRTSRLSISPPSRKDTSSSTNSSNPTSGPSPMSQHHHSPTNPNLNINLNRSLPPTPASYSPPVSPIRRTPPQSSPYNYPYPSHSYANNASAYSLSLSTDPAAFDSEPSYDTSRTSLVPLALEPGRKGDGEGKAHDGALVGKEIVISPRLSRANGLNFLTRRLDSGLGGGELFF